MLELTIPSNSKEAIIKAKERKTNKSNYNLLIGDLEEHGLSVTYRRLEIGSLGHYLSDVALCISHSFQLTKSETKQILQDASKTAIACSAIQETLPVGTRTNPFIVHKTNHSHIFFIASVRILLRVALPSPLPCGVNL